MSVNGKELMEFIGLMLSTKSLVSQVEKLLKDVQMPFIDRESLEDKIKSLSGDGKKALKQAIGDKEVQKVFSILGFKVTDVGVREV